MVPAVRLELANSVEPLVRAYTEGSRRSAVASLITEGEVYVMSDETKQRVGFVITFNR